MSNFLFDTIPASTLTAASVAMGGTNGGWINSAADQDWFRVSLLAGQQYIFDVDGAIPDPTLTLRNLFGGQLVFNDDGGPGLDSRIEFTAGASTTHYLDVGGFGASTGNYVVRARIDDAADDTLTTDSIAVGGSRSGTVNIGTDQDFYRISLVAGQQYIFDVDGVTLADPTLTLRNGASGQLVFNDDGGPGLDSRIEFTAAANGTHYLDVGSFGAGTGNYVLAARVDDVADDISTTDSIAVGGSRSGTVNIGTDQDFFRVNLVAGQQYIFDVDGVTLADPTLTLRNAAGGQLVFNDDGGPGLDSRIEFTAAANGTHYLDVGSFGAGTGSYVLAARVDDAANDIDGLDTIGVGSSRTGTIETGADQDFFRINLVAGQSYIFDVDGGTLADPTLTLRNAAGAQLDFDDDGGPGLDSRIEFTATANGTHYLDVGSFGAGTGSYTLRTVVDDVPADNESDDVAPLAGNPLGTINSSVDQDWWRVSLNAGTTYELSVDGVTLGDPTLALHNMAGAQLAFNDDGGPGLDPLITFTPLVTDTYFMNVGGFGAGTGTYRVDVDIA